MARGHAPVAGFNARMRQAKDRGAKTKAQVEGRLAQGLPPKLDRRQTLARARKKKDELRAQGIELSPRKKALAAAKILADIGHRVPKDASPEAREVAGRAFVRLVEILEQQVDAKEAKVVLQAVTELRDEICGPKVVRTEITGKVTLAALLAEADKDPVALPPPTVESVQ